MGDPHWLPHPVIWIGKIISALESRLLDLSRPAKSLIARGGVLTFTVVSITFVFALLLVKGSGALDSALGAVVTIALLSTTLAVGSLTEAARDVARPLAANNLSAARQAVSKIVGRDTAQLDTHGVARATVETVAENTVDGVTAPLFYALIGGAPLALAYKAVNTMDSMLGYKNERYINFGRIAAKLDDVANWLPARLTVLVMLLASAILRLDTASALVAVKRDGQKHPSPNSGLAEALTAGALGVVLGGENSYGGQQSLRPQLWAAGRPAAVRDIDHTVRLMRLASLLFLLLGLLVRTAVLYFLGKGGLS